MENNVWLMQGDCIEKLKQLEDSSVDSIVTDPPYELGFMGKGWDKSGIANNVEVWKEFFRVLKPGGHMLAFSGSRTYHRMTCAIEDAGFEIRDQIMWVYSSGMPKGANMKGDWEGWSTSLKPSHEPICVARKPVSGTISSNIAQFGTGAFNINACRVGTEKVEKGRAGRSECESEAFGKALMGTVEKEYQEGRWPANFIHDGSAEVMELFPDAKGQQGKITGKEPSSKTDNVYGEYEGRTPSVPRTELDKSAARFFYCAKASKKDRGEGNNHPTVKPQELMKYLVRLVTPPNGVVLDPFMGSGSTGVAAKSEGMKFIGIDMDENYFQIAEKRINGEEQKAA